MIMLLTYAVRIGVVDQVLTRQRKLFVVIVITWSFPKTPKLWERKELHDAGHRKLMKLTSVLSSCWM